jgi:2-polyprenyl-3-methyl-5-hydroxy-6-metoxy-1,4-benzoquinol methylase
MTSNKSARNLQDYSLQYKELPFEPIQIIYRRKKVLEEIAAVSPRTLLEVGCGNLPLFVDLEENLGIKHTIVEPTKQFVENAHASSKHRSDVNIFHGFIEDFSGKDSFDMVVASCVLHEVLDPKKFLSAIRSVCNHNTILHINVPNANSLHRLLAVAMGLIKSQADQSATQKLMQQRTEVYDSLSFNAEIVDAGFKIIRSGSLFIKPFTHLQMQYLVDLGFMTREMLDGLNGLIDALPDNGSELWITAQSL